MARPMVFYKMFEFPIIQHSRATAPAGFPATAETLASSTPATAGKPTVAETPTTAVKPTLAARLGTLETTSSRRELKGVGKAATAETLAIAANPGRRNNGGKN
jgi:hypothetical protein